MGKHTCASADIFACRGIWNESDLADVHARSENYGTELLDGCVYAKPLFGSCFTESNFLKTPQKWRAVGFVFQETGWWTIRNLQIDRNMPCDSLIDINMTHQHVSHIWSFYDSSLLVRLFKIGLKHYTKVDIFRIFIGNVKFGDEMLKLTQKTNCEVIIFVAYDQVHNCWLDEMLSSWI